MPAGCSTRMASPSYRLGRKARTSSRLIRYARSSRRSRPRSTSAWAQPGTARGVPPRRQPRRWFARAAPKGYRGSGPVAIPRTSPASSRRWPERHGVGVTIAQLSSVEVMGVAGGDSFEVRFGEVGAGWQHQMRRQRRLLVDMHRYGFRQVQAQGFLDGRLRILDEPRSEAVVRGGLADQFRTQCFLGFRSFHGLLLQKAGS